MAFGPKDLIMSAPSVGNPPVELIAQACTAADLTGVSIWGVTWPDGSSPTDFATYLHDAGISVFTLEAALSWCGKTMTNREDVASREAEFLTDLGAKVGAEGLIAACMDVYDLDLTLAISGFGALCDRAAERGLWVAIEFMPWSPIPDLATARAIVERAGRENGGLVIDAWHFTRSNAQLDEVDEIAPLVFDFQIDDTAPTIEDDLRQESLHHRLLPGDGTADLIGLIRALDGGGAICPVAIEVFSDEIKRLGPVEATVRAANATRNILAQARDTQYPQA